MSETESGVSHVFIGADTRESLPARVCRHSITEHAKGAVRFVELRHRTLREIGLFSRPWLIGPTGQFYDQKDKKPFSTEFSFTRFLVPAYAEHLGMATRWALFVDCDFLFLRPIEELFALADDRFALMCVKHNQRVLEGSKKMDGMVQAVYPRKNWSSLMLWNLSHPAHKGLTLDAVNEAEGSWLHNFRWLEDDMIGELPESWNWLEGSSDPAIEPNAVHFTLGTPDMPGGATARYGGLWDACVRRMVVSTWL